MQLLIAITILVGSVLLAVFEFLIMPLLVVLACGVIISTILAMLEERNEKVNFRVSNANAIDDDVYWDTIADAVSDGEIPNPNTNVPVIFSE